MKATERQLKSAARGTVTSSSDWDGKTLVQVYNNLREMGVAHGPALALVEGIKDNRIWAMTESLPHVSKNQALVWLLEAHVDSYEAVRRVYGPNYPKRVYEVVEAVWSKRNAEHRQALEDARMAA